MLVRKYAISSVCGYLAAGMMSPEGVSLSVCGVVDQRPSASLTFPLRLPGTISSGARNFFVSASLLRRTPGAPREDNYLLVFGKVG